MPEFRIIRCANAQLYIGAAVLVLGSAAYVLCSKDELWQQMVAILAAVCTPLWAAHYAALRYTVTREGITRRSLIGTASIHWADLSNASITETSNQGTASCCIHLQAGTVSMKISSDLLPLEEVQNLAKELRECGLLP